MKKAVSIGLETQTSGIVALSPSWYSTSTRDAFGRSVAPLNNAAGGENESENQRLGLSRIGGSAQPPPEPAPHSSRSQKPPSWVGATHNTARLPPATGVSITCRVWSAITPGSIPRGNPRRRSEERRVGKSVDL